jgi:hypothetical protein
MDGHNALDYWTQPALPASRHVARCGSLDQIGRGVHLLVHYNASWDRREQRGSPKGLIAPTSSSLPLTNRAGDAQPLDWQLRRIYSACPCC